MICKGKLESDGSLVFESNGQKIISHSLKCKEKNSGYISPGEMFMAALSGCKILTFSKVMKFYNLKFSDLSVEVSAQVELLDNILDTPFKNQKYNEIKTIYTLKTDVKKEKLFEIVKLASKFCTVNIAIDKSIKQTFEIEILE